MIPVSRTVGADRIVDEMVFRFTHTTTIDWMLPGIAPTGRTVEVPLVAIVQFRDGKVAHEHIYWDQASVLVQIGKLDPRGLPVAGAETARKVLDPNLPSNALLGDAWRSSEGSRYKPVDSAKIRCIYTDGAQSRRCRCRDSRRCACYVCSVAVSQLIPVLDQLERERLIRYTNAAIMPEMPHVKNCRTIRTSPTDPIATNQCRQPSDK